MNFIQIRVEGRGSFFVSGQSILQLCTSGNHQTNNGIYIHVQLLVGSSNHYQVPRQLNSIDQYYKQFNVIGIKYCESLYSLKKNEKQVIRIRRISSNNIWKMEKFQFIGIEIVTLKWYFLVKIHQSNHSRNENSTTCLI